MKRADSLFLSLAAAFVVLSALSASPLRAAVFTWNPAAATSAWDAASNWGNVSVPGSDDVAQFAAASYATASAAPDLTSPVCLGGIWNTGAGSITICGSTLTLYSSTINGNIGTGIETDAGAGSLTIDAPMTLANSQQWLLNSAEPMTVIAPVTSSYNLTQSGAGTLTLAANLNIGGTLAVGGKLIQTGGTNSVGSLALCGSGQPFVAGYSLFGGLLSVGQISGSGCWEFDIGGGTLAASGPASWPGFYLSGGAATINNGGFAVTLASPLPLSGPGTLVVNGSGTLTLNGSSSIGGDIVVDGGTVAVPGGSLLTSGNILAGNAAGGALVQTGGTVGFANSLIIANNPGSTGSYKLSGNGLLTASSSAQGNMYVGYSGTGCFSQTGGTVNLPSISAFVGGKASGSYSLSGNGVLNLGSLSLAGANSPGSVSLSQSGQINSSYLSVGGYGEAGEFAQSGGTNLVAAFVNIGGSPSASGTYSLTNGLLSTAPSGHEFLGSSSLTSYYLGFGTAAGVFQQTGGTNATGLIWIGAGSVYQFGGGSLQLGSPGGMQVMSGGTLSGGSAVTNLNVPSNSILDLSGSLVNTGNMNVSVAANSLVIVPSLATTAAFNSFSNAGLTHVLGTTLTVAAGQSLSFPGIVVDPVAVCGTLSDPAGDANGLVLAGGLTISGSGAVNVGSNGAVITSDSASAMTGGLLSGAQQNVGISGSATFTQSGGTNACSSISLGYYGTGNGTYRLNGGLVSSGAEFVCAAFGSGAFIQSGGTNSVYYLSIGQFNSANYTLNGGSLAVAFFSAGSTTSAFDFGGGTLGATLPWSSAIGMNLTGSGGNATIDTTGGWIGLSGNLSGSGGLTKVGPGLLTLGGVNTYGGGTTVAGGTLAVNGSLASAVTVAGGCVLSGTGSVNNLVHVQNNGGLTLGYGGLPATLSAGSLALDTGAVLNYLFASTASGGSGSYVNCSGAVSLGSGATVNLAAASGTLGAGTYPLIGYGTLTGSPSADLIIGSVPASLAGDSFVFSASAGTLDLTVSASAINGQWNVDGGGTWSTPANWSGGNVPGGNANDTATFGPVLTAGTANVVLDSPRSLGALGFSTTGGASYVIAGSNTLTLLAAAGIATISTSTGDHTIAAPLVLASNLAVSASTGSTLSICGAIGETVGGTSLSLSGGGTLVLSGTNTYSGGTMVQGGTLIATNSEALLDGSDLFVGSAAEFGAVAQSSGQNTVAGLSDAVSVPEPGTLALLSAALGGALLYCRRKPEVRSPPRSR